MSNPSEKLRLIWSAPPRDYTVDDELSAARETALLHAQALDEVRRELAREKRRRQQLVLEIMHLRRTNRELQETLDEVQKIVTT